MKNGRYGPYVSHEGTNATLPAEIQWTGTRLNEGAENCDGGGLFWVTFH